MSKLSVLKALFLCWLVGVIVLFPVLSSYFGLFTHAIRMAMYFIWYPAIAGYFIMTYNHS